MEKQCPNCASDGYCVALRRGTCKLRHTQDCRNGASCFNPKCYCMHPVPKCEQYIACRLYECGFRHGKNRTWKCRKGALCDDDPCHALHPTTATSSKTTTAAKSVPAKSAPAKSVPVKPVKTADMKSSQKASHEKVQQPRKKQPVLHASGDGNTRPCLSGEGCVNYSCTFQHPSTRPPLCPQGHDCAARLCLRLHPPRELDQILLKKATGGLGGHFKAISTARKTHKEKLHKTSVRSFALLQQPPEQSAEKRQEQASICQAVEAEALELSQQLINFDRAILQCLECVNPSLVSGVSATPPTKKKDDAQQQGAVVKEAKRRILREVYRLNLALPALSLRHDIETQVTNSQFVVIQGATGSGKSTQLPQYLAEYLHLHNANGRKVICTQPRKVSATSLAERVSEEWSLGNKTHVGAVVGYRVGAVKKSSKFSRIEYVTEGTFLATLLKIFGNNTSGKDEVPSKDPLDGVGAIVVDEAHERSTTCDLILGMLKMHAPAKWPHLKIVITSATLDSKLFSGYFFDCSVLKIPGRMFPVDVKYLPIDNSAAGAGGSSSDKYANAVVKTALEIHHTTQSSSGDILCFLTGQDETEKAKEKFSALCAKLQYGPAMSLALYGRQMPADQKLVFEKAPPGTRKVIFATDVAETGVTIDGVRHIVDSGLCKESRYDPQRNVTVLSVQSICQSSAVQRKGRAGRTAPGTCYRLYSEDDFEAMEISQVPEVLSRPLPLMVISLLSMGIHPLHFQWIQSPDQDGIRKALEELRYLGALYWADVDSIPKLTELGELIATLQVDPGMARMVYHACKQGMGEAACSLAGIMSVASSFYYRGSVNDAEGRAAADAKHLAFSSEYGDMVSMYGAFSEWEAMMNSYQTPSPSKVSSDDQSGSFTTLDMTDTDSIMDELKANDSCTADLKDDDENSEPFVSGLVSRFTALFNGFADEKGPETDLKDDGVDETASEISDDGGSSVISCLSDLTDAAEESFLEVKKSRFAASKLAKTWCRDNFLNNKSLGIALSAKNDIIRLLRTFKDGSLWHNLSDGSPTDQATNPSSADIQRLTVKGLFLNVSVQTREHRGYEVLRNDTPTVGMIHPGCSLAKIANSRSGGRHEAADSYPRLIVFHTMLTTSRTYLNVVTPVEESWIQQESPCFYNDVMVPNMSRARCAKVVIEGLRLNTSRGLLGKFGDKKRELESQLNCFIQYDSSRSALEAWCVPGNVDHATQVLNEKIQAVKRICLDEVEEAVISGNTRAVFGAGGLVQCLVFGSQFVTVNISGLAKTTDATELKGRLGRLFGPVRSVDVTYPSTGMAGKQAGNAFAKVTFCNPVDAARAQEQLQGEVWENHTLTARAGGVKSTAMSSVNSTQVIMSWALSVSEGKASADFSSAAAANAILQFCLPMKGLECPVLQGMGTNVRIRAKMAQTNPKKPAFLFPANHSGFCRVSIMGLHPHVDEQDLVEAFKQIERLKHSNPALHSFACPVRVSVLRSAPQVEVKDETALSIETAELRSMIPLRDHLVSATSFFDSAGQNGRAGFYLQYDSMEATAQVRAAWTKQVDDMQRMNERSVSGEPAWFKCGQPIRLQEKYTSHVNLHSALWNFFRADLEACMASLKDRYQVHCRVAKPKPAIGSNKQYANPKTSLFVNAPSAASLKIAVDALQQLLVCKVYTPRNDEEKHVLFSPPGRRAMVKISDDVTFLHWDNASRVVRVYGPDDKAEAAMQAITDTITRILEAQEMTTYAVSRFKRKELLTAWKVLQGPLKDDIMSFRVDGLELSVQCHPDTAASLRSWLRAGGYITDRKDTAATAGGMQELDEELCQLCLCEVDQPAYYFRACDHGGCVRCLTNQFSQLAEISVPAKCFSMDCQRCLISWSDIKAVVPPAAVDVIKSAAVSKYIRENSDRYRYCPAPGCGQVVDVSAIPVPGSEKDEERTGGRAVYCDECKVEYCLSCSDRDNKPRESHVGDSCADNIEEGNAWRPHFQHVIDNILTLQCPTCKAAFLDFNGCCAVACGGSGCGKYFCGFCLAPSQNSSTSHAHVRTCSKNPRQGDFFSSQDELDKIHRSARIGELRRYFERSVPKGDTKRKLLKNLEPLLADLNIFPSNLF